MIELLNTLLAIITFILKYVLIGAGAGYAIKMVIWSWEWFKNRKKK